MMPTCVVCEGDGMLQIGSSWYCVEHLNEGFLAVADFLAVVNGWHREQTQAALTAWLAS